MIRVKNLTKLFGSTVAVDSISFGVEKGQIVGFLGPNGAGKTTTMRILTCYLPATSGTASVAGHDVMEESLEVRRHIGYLPENVPLYPEMRVEEYLDFRGRLKGLSRNRRHQAVGYVMDRTGATSVSRKLIGALSKGYRQRVGLADALLANPDVVILDEPTVGLDPIQTREARSLIKDLASEHTVLLSTHILSEVELICERVIVIANGRVVLADSLENLRHETLINLEVRGPGDRVEGTLRGIDDVAAVTPLSPTDGIVAFEVRTRDGRDIREAISERMARNGWTIRELTLKRRTLEDAFVEAALSR